MAEQNRATLRNYFKAGKLPAEDHFRDLVDSSLNMVDEGFRKSPANGIEISTLGGERALLSFYTQLDPNTAQWSIAYGDDVDTGRDEGGGAGKRLVFGARTRSEGDLKSGAGARVMTPVMALDPRGYVGVGSDKPQCELDVNGVVRSAGRIGGYKPEHQANRTSVEPSTVPADGKWHDITGPLTGCQAFEVMAGTGGQKGLGRYALLHAVALNAFNPRQGLFDLFWPRKRIRVHEAFYGNRCDRLRLRWHATNDKYGKDAEYCLQIKSWCAYGNDPSDRLPRIQYFITRLWFDPNMDGALPRQA